MKTNKSTKESQETENGPVNPPEPWQENFAHELLSRILADAAPDQTKRRAEPRNTSIGTPCARTWDDAWGAKLEAAEQRLQHRVCGARTMAGNPCELAPNHENGRCRFYRGARPTFDSLRADLGRTKSLEIHELRVLEFDIDFFVCYISLAFWRG